MDKKIWIAAGAALAGAVAFYFLRSRKQEQQNTIPLNENERHHLTNVFSKAKKVAIGN